MPAETGGPEEILYRRVPTDDKAPIGSQGAKTRPASADADGGKAGHKSFDFFCQQFLNASVDRRIARRQLGLITGTEKQSLTLRTKINIVSDVPNKRPAGIDPSQRRRHKKMPPARSQRQLTRACHPRNHVRPGAAGIDNCFRPYRFTVSGDFNTHYHFPARTARTWQS